MDELSRKTETYVKTYGRLIQQRNSTRLQNSAGFARQILKTIQKTCRVSTRQREVLEDICQTFEGHIATSKVFGDQHREELLILYKETRQLYPDKIEGRVYSGKKGYCTQRLHDLEQACIIYPDHLSLLVGDLIFLENHGVNVEAYVHS